MSIKIILHLEDNPPVGRICTATLHIKDSVGEAPPFQERDSTRGKPFGSHSGRGDLQGAVEGLCMSVASMPQFV